MKKMMTRAGSFLLAVILMVSWMPVYAGAETLDFIDIPQDHWAKAEIDYMSSEGYLLGREDGTFGPKESIMRKTVAMLLYRIEGEPEVEGSAPFSDVKQDRYHDAILWASHAGIVSGYYDGTFDPDGELTRQHFAAMLHRYSEYKGYQLPGRVGTYLSDFSDHESIYKWAREACQWAYDNSLINGRADGTFDPLGKTSRAQLAVIMTRFLKLVQKPAGGPVDTSWYDDVLFIGDSRTVGMQWFAPIGNADYFATVGMSVFNCLYERASDDDFSNLKLGELLATTQYGKIFINLGINECGYGHSDLIEQYQEVVDFIRQAQPDAKIILGGILAVSRGFAANGYHFGPENLQSINRKIAALADHETIFYIDPNERFADEDGYLLPGLSSDGCHLYTEGYVQWGQWISEKMGELGL